jgi:predicted nucleotidyltransferase
MAKFPQDPKEIFPEIIDDYKGLFKEDLISIILYGSASGRDYRPGKSDINFMIVLSEDGIERLDKAFKVVKRWQKQKVAIPLFLTELYVESSLDVFPIEYLSFKRNHVLVYGKDILEELTFDRELVRLQCEREIKGKLLLLRQAYMETGGRGRALRDAIGQSVPAFVAIFEALLSFKGKEIPEERRGLVSLTCDTFDLDAGLFQKLLDIKEEVLKPDDAQSKSFFQDYLKEVRKLAIIVDTLGG